MAIASSREYNREMVALLGEFTEIPDSVKLEQSWKLMYSTNKGAKEDFQTSLSLLPVELVRAKIQYFWNLALIQVNTSDVRGYRTLLQDAVYKDKRDFIRILLDFGFVSFLNNDIHDG